MRKLLILFALLYSATSFAQLSPPAQDTFPWFVNYRLPTRVVGTKAPSSIFVMDSTQTKLRAIPTDSITSYIPLSDIVGYKEYVATLTQTGTAAPVATVIYNDLGGTVTWTRDGVGDYDAESDSLFTVGKTFLTIDGGTFFTDGGTMSQIQAVYTIENITLSSVNGTDEMSAWVGLYDSGRLVIRIRVYN